VTGTSSSGVSALPRPAADTDRWSYAALFISILLVLLLHHETVASLVGVWRSSATFAHGMLIPPVSLWLIWHQRAYWRALPCYPLPLLLPALLLTGMLWLCATLVYVPVLRQFALVGMLIVIAIVWQGWARSRVQAFPLLFLLWAVPFGEFLTPSLVGFTTGFTVMVLKLAGIPVLRENNLLSLPSGDWSVQEACSGLRYLISSLAIASLYAFLAMQSCLRRVCFMLAALLLPVLANGVRAVAIIVLGHYTNMRWATGVDHLLYGWIFFALLLLILFRIGARWREVAVPPAPAQACRSPDRGSRVALGTLILLGLSLIIWPALAYLLTQPHGRDLHRLSWQFPPALNSWQAEKPRHTPIAGKQWLFSVPAVAQYTRAGRSVQVEVLAFLPSSSTDSASAPDAEIAGHWQILQAQGRGLALANDNLAVQEMLQQNGRKSQLAWQWYRMQGHNFAALWQLRLQQLISRLRGQSAIAFQIRLSSAESGVDEAPTAALADLLAELYQPLIRELDHAAP